MVIQLELDPGSQIDPATLFIGSLCFSEPVRFHGVVAPNLEEVIVILWFFTQESYAIPEWY